MRRHVLVLWDSDAIFTCTLDAARPLRVGADPAADVVLPVDPLEIAGIGDTTLGRFVVRVTNADDVALPRAPRTIDAAVGCTTLSAIVHATVIASLAVGIHFYPPNEGADEASRLAAMKGYVARIADREPGVEVSRPVLHAGHLVIEDATDAFDATPVLTAPAPALTSKQSIARPSSGAHYGFTGAAPVLHADTGSGGVGGSGTLGPNAGAALRVGDNWSGTYYCAQGITDVVLRVDSVKGDDLRAVFDFTHAPTGVHGSYRLHGHVDPTTGETNLIPDEWIERPGNYVTVGMHGHFTEKTFDGTITNATCGAFNLHRPA